MSDSPWTFAGESAAVGGNDTVTMVDGTTFMVSARTGDVFGSMSQGLFMLDTRVLSRWALRVNGKPIQSLSVTPNGPFSATFVGRIDDPELADAPLAVIQRRHVGRGMREDLEIRNHGAITRQLRVELDAGSDFASLFEVKAGTTEPNGSEAELQADGSLVINAAAVSSLVDYTTITSTLAPSRVDAGVSAWDIELAPGESWANCFVVAVRAEGELIEPSYRCGEAIETAIPVSRLRQWRDDLTTISTDNSILATAFSRATQDLGALRIFDPTHPERAVIAAGAPWFMTLFGRDSLLASWMALPLDPGLAVGVLQELADTQGSRADSSTEEQPGRILHEVRFDQASARLLGGSNIYYGTIDATPLFVMLVAELARWAGMTPEIMALIPAVDRALQWIEEYGDRDGDGFVEYLRSDPRGLENQGWKDSWDGVRHADGSVAVGPIALCEVQGYVYAAFRGRAYLARVLGQNSGTVDRLDQMADDLRASFNERFWLEDQGWYAIGLDGDKQPIGSLTSNIGHLLWTGIVPADRAARLADHLSSPAMFSGWGLRTMASDQTGYNPLSYHCGSVWPHDTALAVAGLGKYQCDEAAGLVTTGLLAASEWTDGRLPELFAGFAADDLPSPVPYPTSCSPQAWAAASPLLLVRSMLGFQPDVPHKQLRLRPRLPPNTSRLHLVNVPVGSLRVTIRIEGNDIAVEGLDDTFSLEIDRPSAG
ncbi:MAG: amylo-alpha-1,6-glucosidase [Acidimicrobiia bacterium]|nr:amylo-alpha-1,6-glucosidase [Acidimicrobiia bacterium]